MKSRIIGCVVALFSLQFVAAIGFEAWRWSAAEASVNVMPMLAFPTATLDVGTVECGRTWTGTVALTNTGKEPARITKVSKSCGCTALDINAGDIIDPGESRDVKLTLDVGSTNAVRSNVVLLCEYSDADNHVLNVASLYLTGVASCPDGHVVDAPTPVPDTLFLEGSKSP